MIPESLILLGIFFWREDLEAAFGAEGGERGLNKPPAVPQEYPEAVYDLGPPLFREAKPPTFSDYSPPSSEVWIRKKRAVFDPKN